MATASRPSPPSDTPRRKSTGPAPAKGAKAGKAARAAKATADGVDLFTTLARTGLFLQALQRECLGEHGLTFTEYSVLRLLGRAPRRRLAPSVLAEEIVCTTGAMTKLVDRLARNGYVEREPDPADRRGVLVQITRDGRRVADAAARTYRAGRERVLGRLGGDEAQEIHAHLGRLLGALETDNASLD